MSKITEMYGMRTDGVKIPFTENEIPLVNSFSQEFASITVTKIMTRDEFKEIYKPVDNLK